MAGVEIVRDDTDLAKQKMDDAVDRVLETLGALCEMYAVAICPVDTGNLKNSINHNKRSGKSIFVGTNVEYAIYVHEGHKTPKTKAKPNGGHVPPRRFLRDAAVNHTDTYKQAAEIAIKGEF